MLLFQDTLGIDAGEALLYSATSALENFVVATGDKVSLKALAKEPACQQIAARLAGRVICLEQIIQLCIGHAGFGTIKDKIVPARGCDKAIKAIFGSGLSATADSVNDGLNSYIADLRVSTGELLIQHSR